MAFLPDDERALGGALPQLPPLRDHSAGFLAAVEHTIERLGAAALITAFGPDVGIVELVGIELDQPKRRADHNVISACVHHIRNRDRARERLRATGTTQVQLTMRIDTPPVTWVLATFEVDGAS